MTASLSKDVWWLYVLCPSAFELHVCLCPLDLQEPHWAHHIHFVLVVAAVVLALWPDFLSDRSANPLCMCPTHQLTHARPKWTWELPRNPSQLNHLYGKEGVYPAENEWNFVAIVSVPPVGVPQECIEKLHVYGRHSHVILRWCCPARSITLREILRHWHELLRSIWLQHAFQQYGWWIFTSCYCVCFFSLWNDMLPRYL